MKQAQDGVASAAALTNKGASALRHALARIQARLREERIRAAIEESKAIREQPYRDDTECACSAPCRSAVTSEHRRHSFH